ncbi:hypothetical protein [Chlamydia muridarum]|uniref:Uncharacterized protein n=1 Tax=Chlamydia muridarum (strain MoPn / Nigg) TaxID=243161 RepID=Q9PJR0_CHLMU|nr:hypothetical protein [Chlamydia muridarum]AAF39571.1 hypothetical protein TC_0768 [Chlamydia muridarum str. Nigg]AHH23154.1 hypothetical protein TAC_04065 [Chlamydia muridarum str. Nigg3 CMUT3-5]AHH24080.1 hypothetical protein Y015_04065 [Chlamydia muridarum str. Nigg CM972]KDU80209.1 hypothetical protein DU17_0850 [Chlamydia muridarum]KDU82012.1 hypothetical protein DU19_0848 [Chlamydia muridarum]
MPISLPTSEVCSTETAELTPEGKERNLTIISGQVVIYPEDPFAIPSVDPCSAS